MDIELTDEEYAFLSEYLKENDKRLLAHRCEAVLKATGNLHEYKTIQSLNWLAPQVNKHRAYEELLETIVRGQTAGNHPQVVEIGCCFGTDIRKLILDGLASKNILAIDLIAGYWQLGFDLFQDAQIIECKTIFCDVTVASRDLTQYLGQYDYAYAMLVLHVFDQKSSLRFMKSIYSLLSAGGTFFGTTVGRKSQDGEWNVSKQPRWIYCQRGLIAALEDAGFSQVSVEMTQLSERLMKSQASSLSTETADRDRDLCCWSFVARKARGL